MVEPVDAVKLIKGGKPIYVMIMKLETDLIMVKIILQISEEYKNLIKAFSPAKTAEQSLHYKEDLAIELISEAQPS
ncbi:hypothetical protein FQN55_006017 [Onygenales sp. PD_40]|nr:hypothetical protein FQN55_006017 [Onygenales sp. PD_40]